MHESFQSYRLFVPTRLIYVHAALLTAFSVCSEYEQQQSGAGNAGAASQHATTFDGSSSPIAISSRKVHIYHVPRRLPAELWDMVGLEFLLPLCFN